MLKKGVLPHHVSILLPFSWGVQYQHLEGLGMSRKKEHTYSKSAKMQKKTFKNAWDLGDELSQNNAKDFTKDNTMEFIKMLGCHWQ
jgi:hypothetical protein